MSEGTNEDVDDGGTVTLAFGLAAIDALATPHDVFSDARRWSQYVGIVDDDARAVATFVERHGLQQDFVLDELDKQAVLSKLKWEAGTDRYVFVGTSRENRALADHVGWEYVPVEDAAENAGWTLAVDAGTRERIRSRFLQLVPWSVGCLK